MKRLIFSLITIFGITAMSNSQVQIEKPVSSKTTVTTRNQPIVDFNKKQVMKRRGTTTSSTPTARRTVRTAPVVVRESTTPAVVNRSPRRTVDFNNKRVTTTQSVRTEVKTDNGKHKGHYKKKWKKGKRHHDNRNKSKHHDN